MHTTASDYTVVYDVWQVAFAYVPFAGIALIFVAIGVGMFRYPDLPMFRSASIGKWFRHFFLGFAVFLALVGGWSGYVTYGRLAGAVARHEAKVAEGRVRDYWPMPAGGHGTEHFCVADACFEYSDFIVDGGFNNTASHGGPIREGLPVRVTYVGDKIVRLEVATE